MQCEFFSAWLAHYDPIHRGYTPRGIANGVCATAGWFFPRVAGGHNLYRGPTAETLDTAHPVGAAGPRAETVSNFSWRPHPAGQEHFHALAAIGGGGVESALGEPPVSVLLDAVGNSLGGRPNAPADLAVAPTAEGRFTLRWTYTAAGQEAAPIEFRVHGDNGSGVVDFAEPIAVVPYHLRRLHFVYTTEPHEHGAVRRWAVRAVSAEGRDDGQVNVVEAVADAQGPPPHPHLIVECVEA